MSRELPSGTFTFLFTDVEGSTRLLHELGDRYGHALGEHRRVLREAFARHDGVEVDTQGDAFLYAFPSATGALVAALEGQEALSSGAIRVRMGLHTGEPQLTDEGYVGLDVHKGARIAAAAHGGQVVLSKETRDLVDADVTDLGEHRVKDFAEAVWLFQLGEERFPPLKTISNTNLPRPASSFVGRRREVSEVVSLLRDGSRLVTLSGPGRVGQDAAGNRGRLRAGARVQERRLLGRSRHAARSGAGNRDGRRNASAPGTDWRSTSASVSCCSCSTISSRWWRRRLSLPPARDVPESASARHE